MSHGSVAEQKEAHLIGLPCFEEMAELKEWINEHT